MRKVWKWRWYTFLIIISINLVLIIISIVFPIAIIILIIFDILLPLIVKLLLMPKLKEIEEKELEKDKLNDNNDPQQDAQEQLSKSSYNFEHNLPMTKEKIEERLGKSHPKDWSYNDTEGIYTYRNDVSLTIRIRDDVLGNGDDFHEDWGENFSNPEAKRIFVRVFYGSSFIEDYLYVFVDGYRNIVPAPKSFNDLRISKFQYNLGRILDCNHPFYKDDNLRD